MNPSPFEALGLPPQLVSGIEALGFEKPSPIQSAAIPPGLAGADLVGLSETGSGKTAAFALPALASINLGNLSPQVLILCPTRELAIQVSEETLRLASFLRDFRILAVYGGSPIPRQMHALKRGVHLIVGTPGRVLDHLRRGSFDPTNIRLCVLDEADRMLDMGFRDEMESLLEQLPTERQTLFFSATMNKGVTRLIEQFGDNPKTIEIERKQLTVESIDQVCYEVRNSSKIEVISRILDIEQPRLAVIFCNTKKDVDTCTDKLLARGYAADRLHGDISQILRERVLRRFREGTINVLVATDVAARGLDVENIDLVINYQLPQDPEDYVHRVGRTGRAGRSGRAISFIYGRDIYRLKTIERFVNQRIVKEPIPSLHEVKGHIQNQFFDQLRSRIGAGELQKEQAEVAELHKEGFAVEDIAASALALLLETTDRESEFIAEDKPKRRRDEPRFDKKDSDKKKKGKKQKERFTKDPDFKPDPNPSGMVSLYLNKGKKNKVGAGDIAGMLYNQASLPKGSVGRIHISFKHSTIELNSEYAEQVIEMARTAKLKNDTFRLDYDRGRSKKRHKRGPRK